MPPIQRKVGLKKQMKKALNEYSLFSFYSLNLKFSDEIVTP